MSVRLGHAGTRRRAVTLVELLVALGIIAVLVAVTLPALQSVRAASRRATCAANLRQIGLAIHAYSTNHAMLPPGAANGFSLHAALLPYVDLETVYNAINFSVAPDEPENHTALTSAVEMYQCPSDPSSAVARLGGARATNYAGSFGTGVQTYGYNGLFRHLETASRRWPEGPVRPADVVDGLAVTAAISEVLVADGTNQVRRVIWQTPWPLVGPGQLQAFAWACSRLARASSPGQDAWSRGGPWLLGDAAYTLYNHVLPPNQKACYNGTRVQEGAYPPSSLHRCGVNTLMADGHVQFVSDRVDPEVWRALGSRNGLETVSLRDRF